MNAQPQAFHAVWAPSSAHRWTKCTASAEGIANSGAKLDLAEGTDEEGTEAHAEIERLLRPLAEYGLAEFVIDPEHPALLGIGLMFDYVRKLMLHNTDRVWIEERKIRELVRARGGDEVGRLIIARNWRRHRHRSCSRYR